MALPSWANDTIVRKRPGTIDRRGSTEPDWSKTTDLTIAGCSMQPASTSLSQDGRVLGIADAYTLYCPPGTDIQAGDKISYNGNDYLVNGEIRIWNSPTGRVSSLQAQLQRWEG